MDATKDAKALVFAAKAPTEQELNQTRAKFSARFEQFKLLKKDYEACEESLQAMIDEVYHILPTLEAMSRSIPYDTDNALRCYRFAKESAAEMDLKLNGIAVLETPTFEKEEDVAGLGQPEPAAVANEKGANEVKQEAKFRLSGAAP